MTFWVHIEKATRRLYFMSAERVERTFPVLLGKNLAADKQVEGDNATPLGDYYICARNPRSRFFLSLCLSYPNRADAQRGLAAGLINESEHAHIVAAIDSRQMPPQHTALGGEIYIHGSGGSGGNTSPERPWTRGCIALDNAAMQELYDLAQLGTVVRITRRSPAALPPAAAAGVGEIRCAPTTD